MLRTTRPARPAFLCREKMEAGNGALGNSKVILEERGSGSRIATSAPLALTLSARVRSKKCFPLLSCRLRKRGMGRGRR